MSKTRSRHLCDLRARGTFHHSGVCWNGGTGGGGGGLRLQGSPAYAEACLWVTLAKRALQAYLGHRNIQHTVRYTELSPDRFKDFWR